MSQRKARDGRDGRDGKDADPALTRRLVDAAVAKAVAAIPKPKDGLRGEPGQDGKDVDPIALTALVDDFVQRADALRPPAERGPKGDKGDKGDQGEKGDPGERGPMPDHRWKGTSLQFQKPAGGWGKAVELQGPPGIAAYGGIGGSFSIDSLPFGDTSTPEQIVVKQNGVWVRIAWDDFLDMVGATPSPYTPSLDFSDARNSQYIGAVHL